MILTICLVASAALLLFVLLAIKVKKNRLLFAVLALIALLPAGATGLIAAGQGDLLNYPGLPGTTVIQFAGRLSEGRFAAAEKYVVGTLGLEDENLSEAAAALLQEMTEQYHVELQGKAQINGFTAAQTAALTYVDVEAWLTALEAETVKVLDELVQTRAKKDVFNEEGSGYLPGIPEEAYDTALQRMLGRLDEFLMTETLDVNLLWTPAGWRILADERLVNLLEGYSLGEPGAVVFKGYSAERLSAGLQTAEGNILEALPFIEKIYTIAADAVAGPVPNPAAFGKTTDPYEVQAVVEKAEKLLNGRKLSWNPDVEIKEGSEIQYYYDETILAIQWKERRSWSLVTFAEVVLQDGSQIRRCISGDSYRNFAWETPTEMSKRTNSVLAITGDFYMYRAIGIMVYQGEIYRDDPQSLHHLFVTNSGDLLMTKSWEVSAKDARQFVEDNDVSFSVAFGPAIIENGEKLELPNYLVGEFYDDYPRAAIGEVDHLHYILMTVGKEGPRENQTVTLPEAVNYIHEKGVQTAYALDGGRTANMTFNGELTNEPRYRKERTMSDLIYFCSALPEEER